MSYTIPTSVQTKAEAVLAVASAIADEDMGARYDGTVNTSLDVLADVLAAQDVQVPQTNAGAILALAQYAHGGGGGGAQTVDANIWNRTEDESLMAVLPVEVRYITGVDAEQESSMLSDPLPIEHITGEASGTTFHGVKVTGLPVGASVRLLFANSEIYLDTLGFGLTQNGAANERLLAAGEHTVLRPLDGYVITGQYELGIQQG